MGGDNGPPVTVPAAVASLQKHAELHLILVGDEKTLQQALSSHSYDAKRLTIQHASQVVRMDEAPSHALRTKKDSSMRVAINLVKEGRAQGCVSAGNTGALMATARFVLKTISGIDRPAIVSAFPTSNPHKNVRMLDLGANVDSTAEHLVQFAIMGSALATAIDHIPHPRVFLLNIGAEEIKGNELVKKTAQLLTNSNLINYAGFIEGDELYKGEADVIVCDGFVGNVALKTTEGVVTYIASLIRAAFSRNLATKLLGLLVRPLLKSMKKRLDPAEFNGAAFLGLQNVVIKSHGNTTVKGFAHAIEEAMLGVKNNVPELIRTQIEPLLKTASE